MQYYDIFLLGLALAVDAVIVAFSYGVVIKHHRMRNALGLGISTGLGQFVMPLLGFLLAYSLRSQIEQWDHWIAFSIFLLLGLKVITDAFKKDEDDIESIPHKLTFKILLFTALATSIDALAAGATLFMCEHGTSDNLNIWITAAIIGVITLVCTTGGFFSARLVHHLPRKPLEIAAGLVLIGLGVKILYEHMAV